jgi:hypothetical protein
MFIIQDLGADPNEVRDWERVIVMNPRGQLWFEVEKICRDFKDYSGLKQKEALEVLIAVLGKMLEKQKAALEKLMPPSQG